MQVGTYSGVPEISVPLYTINVKDLTIPISISYNSSGIQAGAEASRVGLGWSLNAGGTISREILGLDDLIQNYGFGNYNLIGVPQKYCISTFYLPFAAYTYDITNYIGPGDDPSKIFLKRDLEPDIFYCNFLGINGKFMLRKTDTTAIFEDPTINMKIKLKINQVLDASITATGADGAIYNFEKFETCVTQGGFGDGGQPQRITAWYITKVTTARGTVANFNYSNISGGTNLIQPMNQAGNSCPIQYAYTWSYVNHALTPAHNYDYQLLTSITFDGGSVAFNYDTRQDLKNDMRLTSLVVTNSNGLIIKKVNLQQDYFHANASTDNQFNVRGVDWDDRPLDSTFLKLRLKLTGITEASADGQLSLATKFQYDETLLPLKNTTSKDHWGFFNNAPNKDNLLPTMDVHFPALLRKQSPPEYNCTPTDGNDYSSENFIFQEINQPVDYHLKGADREVNPQYDQAFILKKIIYPTGGSTAFTYEQNTYDFTNSFVTDTAAYGYEFNYKPVKDTVFLQGGIKVIMKSTVSQSFTIAASDLLPGETSKPVTLNFHALAYSLATATNPNGNTFVRLKNAAGTVLTIASFNSLTTFSNNGNNDYSILFFTGNLVPDTYTIEVAMAGTDAEASATYYSVSRDWNVNHSLDVPNTKYRYAGGLRIKNISNYGTDASLLTSKDYIYDFTKTVNGVSGLYSSGKLHERPSYFMADFISDQYFGRINCESGVQLKIGYDSVLVQEGTQRRHLDVYRNTPYRAIQYKTYYSSAPNNEMMPSGPLRTWGLLMPDQSTRYIDVMFDAKPQGAKPFTDLANGKLTRSVDYLYNVTDNSYKPLKVTVNNWGSNGTGGDVIWADHVATTYSTTTDFIICRKGMPPQYSITNYIYPALKSENISLRSGVDTLFSQDGGVPLVTNTTYTYDQLGNQLISKCVVNSKNQTNCTNYTYAAQYNTTSLAWIKRLNSANVVNVPIEIRETVDGLTTHGLFSQFDTANNIYVPTQLYQTELTVPVNDPATIPSGTLSGNYKLRASMKYDAHGNVIEASYTNNVKIAYLWGYNYTYPVAQVTGADYATVAALVNQSVLNNPVSDQQLRDEVNKVRTGLASSGAQVITNTYIPLLGKSSTTTAAGINTYYEYDGLGRLKLIRDNDQHILKVYDYKYTQVN